MGLNVKELLTRAEEGVRSCSPGVPLQEHPGALLGVAISACAKASRDKLTIVTDPNIATLGLWIEQLVAESTGKEGKGILPVVGEELGPPGVYGNDRLFVSVGQGSEARSQLVELEHANQPVVQTTLRDLYDLGREFFIWEFATAVAGWGLGINPFDQPNVQEAKDATKELLKNFEQNGKLEEQPVLAMDDLLTIYADKKTLEVLPATSVKDAIRAHLGSVKPGDYVALLNYIEETPVIEATVEAIRTHLRDATRCATTVGYGPRFLHSTGQLHKGGPDSGLFIQITAPDQTDFPVPGETYTFSILKQAQALGDFRALSSRGRRIVRVDLGDDAVAGLVRLQSLIVEVVPALTFKQEA
jgi:hypothetical protein